MQIIIIGLDGLISSQWFPISSLKFRRKASSA
jgi:hypothetical protein